MQTDDLGRAVDFTAPYAPYQPDDVDWSAMMAMSDNGLSAANCSHVVYCRQCDAAFEAYVQRWP
jgi:isoleucyl-tRNA synthetase